MKMFIKKNKKELVFLSVYLIFCLFVLPRFITLTQIIGNSMYPTLENKQFVLTTKYYKKIKKGDLIITKSLHNPKNLIVKRVIATPNDTIQIIDKQVHINNQKLDEPYVFYEKNLPMINSLKKPLKLKENEYFIMGDNRNNSYDSRQGGPIKKKIL